MGMTVTDIDLGSVVQGGGKYWDELLTFAAAGIVKAGTILARKRVADAVVVAAGEENTGDGTVTAASVTAGQIIPIAGEYVLTCVTAVTTGGVFELADPNGAIVAKDITLTAGEGAATVIKAGGLVFTVTVGETDFVVGDSFTITVAANGKLVPFAADGAGGAQIPTAVVTYDVVAAGAGDLSIRALVGGDVRKEKLIIHADGTGANVSTAILDQLRGVGITAVDVKELNIQDNQ